MARYERFTFLCNLDERQAIADLAMRLQRSQSDAVRYVVIETAKQLMKTYPIVLSEKVTEQEQGDLHSAAEVLQGLQTLDQGS